MAKYITVAPNGVQVTISYAYGNKTFMHGEEITNDKLAIVFPNLFIKVDETPQVVEPIIEQEPEVKIEVERHLFNVDYVDNTEEKLFDLESPVTKTEDEKIELPKGVKLVKEMPRKPIKLNIKKKD